MSDSFEFEVVGELPPLKGEAKSMLSEGHKQARRVLALLNAAYAAKLRDGFVGFGSRRIGMQLTVRPDGASPRDRLSPLGDATNALGGVGDTLQAERSNIDLSYLGELAGAFLYDNDDQIREVIYREQPGARGYTLRLWAL